jgi:uncharacterized protein (TIGR02453 family)
VPSSTDILIAGGGIAGLEALLALHATAGDRVRLTLVAPDPDFTYRPLAVAEPFSAGHRYRVPLSEVAAATDAELVLDAFVEVDDAARTVRLSGGRTLGFDALLVAPGGRAVAGVDGASTWWPGGDPDHYGGRLRDVEEGYAKRLAVVVPAGAVWPLPAYELALMTVGEARAMGQDDVQVTVVTPERRPLVLFGPEASAAVYDELRTAGVGLRTGVVAVVEPGGVLLEPGGEHLPAQRVVAVPRVVGPGLEGLPADEDGFILAGDDARVVGCERTWGGRRRRRLPGEVRWPGDAPGAAGGGRDRADGGRGRRAGSRRAGAAWPPARRPAQPPAAGERRRRGRAAVVARRQGGGRVPAALADRTRDRAARDRPVHAERGRDRSPAAAGHGPRGAVPERARAPVRPALVGGRLARRARAARRGALKRLGPRALDLARRPRAARRRALKRRRPRAAGPERRPRAASSADAPAAGRLSAACHAPAMDAAFQGFAPSVFEWFAGLERDNSKSYFTATRELYETEVRGGLEAMLDELVEQFGGDVKVFRQQRDVRFSPDKSPYKTTTYGIIQGGPGPGQALYAQLSARGLYAGTGYYMMARDQLDRFRAAVADDRSGPALADAAAGAEAAGLELEGEELRTAPRGYPRDHPRIALLRRKSVIAGRALPGAGGIERAAALEHVASTWRAAEPLNAWLDEHVGPSTEPPAERYGRGRRR